MLRRYRWLVVLLSLVLPRTALADNASFFVYLLTNPANLPNTVVGMRVNDNGNLAALPGSPFLTGGNGAASPSGGDYAHRLAVSRSRNRLFAANEQQGSVAVFDLNPTSGALTAVAGSPFNISGCAAIAGMSLAVSNDGLLLYVACGANAMSRRVESNGSLTPIGSGWSFASRINGIAVSEANDLLYLARPNEVTVLRTGPSGLTSPATPQVPPLALGNVPTDVAVSHDGGLVYVGSRNGGINAFRWDGTAHAPLLGSPFFVGTTHLSGLVSDYYERVLVAFGATAPRMLSAVIEGNGALTSANGSPTLPSITPTGGALSPDGRLLLLSSAAGQLDAWRVDDLGSLQHLVNYPTSLGVGTGQTKLVTFPDKSPTPAPALPLGAVTLLALALAGVARARSASARARE